MLKALWVAAAIQRSIEQPSSERCQQTAKFLHDPRRDWVQQARFMRRLTDQFNNFVGLSMGAMVDKTGRSTGRQRRQGGGCSCSDSFAFLLEKRRELISRHLIATERFDECKMESNVATAFWDCLYTIVVNACFILCLLTNKVNKYNLAAKSTSFQPLTVITELCCYLELFFKPLKCLRQAALYMPIDGADGFIDRIQGPS
jgi:hypothetical protein